MSALAHSQQIDAAIGIARQFAEQALGQNMQWALDPQYLLRYCDEIVTLRMERDGARCQPIEECASVIGDYDDVVLAVKAVRVLLNHEGFTKGEVSAQ